MKIIRGIDQGTPEWFALRRGKPSASLFKTVMSKGDGRTRLLYELKGEHGGADRATISSDAMRWGVETEPQARAVYELMSGNEVEQVAMVFRDDGMVLASPDGLVGASGGLEIKCPNTVTHLRYRDRPNMPSEYVAQVQGCLWVCEREWWDFVTFDPRLTKRPDWQYHCIRVYRDEAYIKTLAAEVERFVAELLALLDDDDTVPGLDDIAVGIQEVEA